MAIIPELAMYYINLLNAQAKVTAAIYATHDIIFANRWRFPKVRAGFLGCWVAGLLGFWVFGLLGCWVAGLLGCWVSGCWVLGAGVLLGCWAAGLPVCRVLTITF